MSRRPAVALKHLCAALNGKDLAAIKHSMQYPFVRNAHESTAGNDCSNALTLKEHGNNAWRSRVLTQ